MNPDDDRLLQDIVCGDAAESDPEIRSRLDANPQLRSRLAALYVARKDLVELGVVAEPLGTEAAQLVAPEDRVRVAAALAPRPRRATRWWALTLTSIGAAAMMFVLWCDGENGVIDGRLGSATAVALQREGDRWRIVVQDALPPGTSYHLRLELADGTSSTATAESRAWDFPDAWNQSVSRATAAKLVIEWDDGTGLVVRRVLQLP
jgi:hypothetical protein